MASLPNVGLVVIPSFLKRCNPNFSVCYSSNCVSKRAHLWFFDTTRTPVIFTPGGFEVDHLYNTFTPKFQPIIEKGISLGTITYDFIHAFLRLQLCVRPPWDPGSWSVLWWFCHSVVRVTSQFDCIKKYCLGPSVANPATGVRCSPPRISI